MASQARKTGLILGTGLLVGLFVHFFSVFTWTRGLASGLGGLDRPYLQGLIWACLIFLGVAAWPMNSKTKVHLCLLWILRSVVALGFMLLYEYHYVKLDAFVFFRHGLLHQGALEFEWGQGSLNILSLIAILTRWIPGFDSYHSVKVFMSFLGFLGSYFFWRSYVLAFGRQDHRVLWLVSAFPSIIFWSSILGKDPVIFFGLGLSAMGAMGFLKHPRWTWIGTLVLGIAVVASIRLWTAAAFLLAFSLVALNLSGDRLRGYAWAKPVIWCGLFVVAGFMLKTFKVQDRTDLLDRVNVISRGWSKGGSGQEVPEIGSPAQALRFLPVGMFTALFRPLPGEVNNAFGLVAGLENLLLLWIVFSAIKNMQKEVYQDSAYQLLAYMTVAWAMVYAFISYQNLGSAVRFKLQVLPFLLLLPFASQVLVKRRNLELHQ